MDEKDEWEGVEEPQESEETCGPEEPCVDEDPEEPEYYPEETAEMDAAEILAGGRGINWLGVVAIFLSAFGLFIGYSAKRSVNAPRTEIEQVTSSKGSLAYLEEQANSVERRMVKVGAIFPGIKNLSHRRRLELCNHF